jgi:uncharacterized protein
MIQTNSGGASGAIVSVALPGRYVSVMSDLAGLRAYLEGLGRVLLGFSGGVDSALLAVAGTRALGAERFLAVIGLSASYPEVQRYAALDLASRFDVPLLELTTRELDDPRYVANPTNRCYFCKTELWQQLRAVAAARRFDAIIDGTNADDLGEHRPGLQAAGEYAIRSPLAELGWTKADIRRTARELGIPIWNAPAAPCLASRIRYGVAVTPDRLRQVESAEAFLRALGLVGNLRVRHLGAGARLEVEPDQFGVLEERWDDVRQFFQGIGFVDVERDPHGYRRGSLLSLAPVA